MLIMSLMDKQKKSLTNGDMIQFDQQDRFEKMVLPEGEKNE
jgi:hypothetical protein